MRFGAKVGKDCGILYAAKAAAASDANRRFVTGKYFRWHAAFPLEFHCSAAA